MGTINDIKLDADYSHATCEFLLLNDDHPISDGPSPIIPLRHASLMTFIRVFHDLFQCQQYISSDNRKMIILVISNKQLINWNKEIDVIDPNLSKLNTFCDTYFDYLRMKRWNGCYKNKIQDVYQSDKLDYKLIHSGIDHIRTVMKEFQGDRGLCRKLNTDARKLITALAGYFDDEMDDSDDMSVEESY